MPVMLALQCVLLAVSFRAFHNWQYLTMCEEKQAITLGHISHEADG